MTTNNGLPEGWAMDYDGSRWFYTFKSTGVVIYRWPQPGDEFPEFDTVGSVGLPPMNSTPTERIQHNASPPKIPQKSNSTGMSATGGPMSFYDNIEFGNTDFFQPDALMYMGPGAYDDVSPIGNEDIEQPLPDKKSNVSTIFSETVSPFPSTTTTPFMRHAELRTSPSNVSIHSQASKSSSHHKPPASQLSFSGRIDNMASSHQSSDIHMLDSREIQTKTRRNPPAPNPLGYVAELPTDSTTQAFVNHVPVELSGASSAVRKHIPFLDGACDEVPLPIDAVELPSCPVPTSSAEEEQEKERLRIRSQQKPYGERQYPFQPNHESEKTKEAAAKDALVAPVEPVALAAPPVPPKILQGGGNIEFKPAPGKLSESRFRPFKPSAEPQPVKVQQMSETITQRVRHFSQTTEARNPRLSALNPPTYHHLHGVSSLPQMRPRSLAPPRSTTMLPRSIPTPPKFPGPEQPPLSLQPGILAENIVLSPRSMMQMAPPTRTSPLSPRQTPTQKSSPMDSVRQPSPKSSLPYPDDGHNLIPDIERSGNTAPYPSSSPVSNGMTQGGSSIQRQGAPPVSAAPGPVEKTHRHPDFHIPGFPGHNIRPLDSNNGRRRSSGVSPMSASTTGPLSTGPISSASSTPPATVSSEGSGRRASGYFPPGATDSNDGINRQSTGNLPASRMRPRNQGRRKSSLALSSQASDAPVGNTPTAGPSKIRPMSMVVPGEAAKKGQSQNMVGLHSIEEHAPVPAALAVGPRSRQSSISSFMSNQPQLQSPGALSPGSQKSKTPEYSTGPGRPVSLPAPSRSSTPTSLSSRPTVPALQTNLRIAQEASSPESVKKSHKPSLSASLSPKGLREKSRWLTKKLFKGGSSFKVLETKIPDSVILSTSQDPRVQFTPLWQQQESTGPRISREDPLRSQPPWAMSYPNYAKNSPGLSMDGTRSISETLPAPPQSHAIESQVKDTTPPPTSNDSPQARLTVDGPTVGTRSGTPVSALTISRNQSDSSRCSGAKLPPPSELGDGVSDQASVSTMDIIDAHAQPVLRPQGPQLIEVRSSTSIERSPSPPEKTSMGPQQTKENSVADTQLISPLSVPKKKQRKSVASARVPYHDPLAELESEDVPARQADEKDTPVQGHRKVSSEVLVNELMNSLLSKDKRLHSSSMTPGKETQSFFVRN